jgi:phosphoribosylaminoimidazolecarboxamide formyltransferase/IMP cyclohydrolase
MRRSLELLFAWKLVRYMLRAMRLSSTKDRQIPWRWCGADATSVLCLAVEQAGESAKGAVLAFDAFFPISLMAQAAADAGNYCHYSNWRIR